MVSFIIMHFFDYESLDSYCTLITTTCQLVEDALND